jgi:hypothetical protein
MTWPGNRIPDDDIVDVGIITVGGVTEAWGATIDGLQWDPGKKVRHPEWDGRTFEHEAMHRTTGYDAKLSGKVKRGGPAFMLDLEPGSSSDGGSDSDGNTVTLLDARTPWAEGDYLEDVYYIGRQQDRVLMRVYMPRAYIKSYKLTTKDNDEGQWDIELVPVQPASETNVYAIPFFYQYVAEE